MTNDQYELLGKACQEANDGNLVVGSFAAELIGESYPLSKSMFTVVFSSYSDLDLGRKFEEWVRRVYI